MKVFDGSLNSIESIATRYESARVSEDLSPSEDMINLGDPDSLVNYMRVGRNAIEIILSSMLITNRHRVGSILDMPSGFGRVTRHLVAAFPEAKVSACDLYLDRIDYCAKVFGATPIKSTENISDLAFAEHFDLIWCGSLLTHLPKQKFIDTIRLLSRSLAQDGIAIATTHGRFSPWYNHERSQYLSNDAFLVAERGFYRAGFGYAEYANATQVYGQETYGVSLSSIGFIGEVLETDTSIRIVSFIERGWDGHQDVLVFRKSPIYN